MANFVQFQSNKVRLTLNTPYTIHELSNFVAEDKPVDLVLVTADEKKVTYTLPANALRNVIIGML